MGLLLWAKIKDFFKKYWQYIAIFGAGVASVLFFKKKSAAHEDTKTIRDSYDKQIDQINNVRQIERDKQHGLSEKLQTDLSMVEKQYEQQKKNLDEKKKEEIKTILQQHQDDPKGLVKKLSEVTGFKVIMPKE